MSVSDSGMDVLQLHTSPPKRPACTPMSPVAKRPKLSAEEKLERERVKEAERAAKEAEKAAKEAEKAARDAEREAERAAKEAEKESKRLEREEKRKIKEDAKAREKQLKDEAKAKELAAQEKKEKAQLRMGNFFKKADPRPPPPLLCKEASAVFKPFYVKEHVRLAPLPKTNLEDDLFTSALSTAPLPDPGKQSHFRKSRSAVDRCRLRTNRTLRQRLSETSNVPLTERLQDVRYKLLQFHSDVRPAYFGTMTTVPTHRGLGKGRKPYAKTVELNYDYDSEADWIQGDDEDAGEEIGDDDDMSDASRDTYADDSDDFLDDEDEKVTHTARARQDGSLLPSLLGIFTIDDCQPVEHMKMQKLLDIDGPIDPFRNYWEPLKTGDAKIVVAKESHGILSAATTSGNQSPNVLRKSSSTPSSFPDKFLPDFKKAIQGSNLTKILLVEKLRSDFRPFKISKKAIEDKLGEVAQRLGKGQHDVWTLRN